MSRKLTKFQFFKNVPLNDFQNTIHFKSNAERDDYFLRGRHFPSITFDKEFNWVRDHSEVQLPTSYESMDGVNYCTFLDGFSNQRFYAFVLEKEYINDRVTKMYLLIDVLMTYTQGDVIKQNAEKVFINRMHYNQYDYKKHLHYLRNNDDVLKTTTKKYIKSNSKIFKDFWVLMLASVNLQKDFGDEDDPKMATSSGTVYDNIPSPLNIYIVSLDDFPKFMRSLSNYPWIAQNINKNFVLPKDIVTDRYFNKVNTKGDNPPTVYQITGKGKSFDVTIDSMELDFDKLCNIFDLDPETEGHLLRNEYTTTELYSYDGQRIMIDNGLINRDTSVKNKLHVMTNAGYHNEFAFYYTNYMRQTNEHHDTGVKDGGMFLNNAIVWNTFNEIPMLIDNYQLGLAQNAHQRELAEDKLLSSRIEGVTDEDASPRSRLMDGISLLSNANPVNFMGKITDEYEFYRTQKAQQKDLAISSPTITAQSDANSFQIANDFYGITKKHAFLDSQELQRVKRYYNGFGFQVEDFGQPEIETMTVCNYVQFSGNWVLPDIDPNLMSILKSQLENGVRFWHNDGSKDPLKQDLLTNKWR
ncbi:phage tail protein [Tetragenococcus phage phiYA5_2]|nr:phage tail protein [Tetragenococcus phage phiYA5_2]